MSVIVEFADEVEGVYFRRVRMPIAGIRIPQHTHSYGHPTLCLAGRALLYVDGVATNMVGPGDIVPIQANRKHEFESLVPNTELICITPSELAESDKAIMLGERSISELETT